MDIMPFEKNNNINNKLPRDKNDQNVQSHSKSPIAKCVLDLCSFSENGNDKMLKQITEDKLFSGFSLNLALRRLIPKYDSKNENYIECVNILLQQNIDLNYQNENDNSSTILMIISGNGDVNLIRQIISYKNDNNLSSPINFSMKDNNNFTFIHYICYRNSNEGDAIEIIDYFFNELSGKNKKLYSLFVSMLYMKDNNGNVALSVCLLKGWHKMVMKLLTHGEFKQNYNSNNNNFIHCAVIGKNIKCLKISLFYSTIEDIKAKNVDGLTPSLLAIKKGYYIFAKLIDNFENNFDHEIYRRSFYEKISEGARPIDLLDSFQEKEYESVLCKLHQYKLSLGILNNNLTNNNLNSNNGEGNTSNEDLSLEWNILLTKYKLYITKPNNNFKINLSNLSSSNTNNTSTKKNAQNNHQIQASSLSNSLFPYHSDIKNFFTNHSFTTPCSSDDLSPIDIIIYNKIIFYIKAKEPNKVLETISFYLNEILPINDAVYYKWIMYVNITLILIEIFTSLGYTNIVAILIESIEEFLFTNYNLKNDLTYSLDNQRVSEYLNDSEVLNQFSPTWDESFCYVNLLKTMQNFEKCNEYLKHYKKLIKECIYIKELKIFKRLQLFYISLKIKKNYFQNYTKCFKKLDFIKNERIDNENKIFYFNTLGILNLKLKNFAFAEFQFRNAIKIYKLMINDKKNIYFNINIDYIASIKYNIGLCLFYQKKFISAKEIFTSLTKIKGMKSNYFLWFRLGLCNLEIELSKKSKIKKGYNEIVENIEGFENNHKEKEDECISIDLNNSNNENNENDEGNCDDLFEQFEKEYGSGNNNSTHSNSSSSAHNNNNEKADNKNIKPIFKKYERFILHSRTFRPVNIKQNVLNEAIVAFKNCILLSNISIIKRENIKSIMNFYTKKKTNINKNNDNSYYERKINTNVVINAYMNLLFCFALNEDWLKLLFIIEEIGKKKFNLSNDQKIKIMNFKIEALIRLNKLNEAQLNITKTFENFHNCNYKFDYFSKGNYAYYTGLNFKLNLYYGMCLICLKNNKIKEADECIDNILSNYFKDKTILPSFLINLMIYINLIKYNSNERDEDENKEKYYKNVLNLIKIKRSSMMKSSTNYY